MTDVTTDPGESPPDEDLSAADLAYQQALKYGHDLRRVYLAEKAKRQELELTNQMLSAVFASTPDGLVVLDNNLVIQKANPIFHQLVEKPTEKLEDLPLEKVLPSDELLMTLRTLAAAQSNHAQVELNLESPVKRSLLANIARLEAGAQHGWVVLLHDQTERKRLEYQKTEFINIAAHELRTPLTSLIGLSELLWEALEERAAEDTVQCVDGIRRSSYRLANTVEQLIAFTQLTEGTIESRSITELDLHDLLQGIIDELQPRAAEKQVTLSLNDLSDGAPMFANAVQLRAALYQLMMNGINFNKPGGTVTVRLTQSNGQVHIQIADTGLGIPQTELETIFSPFVQIEEHSTRRVGGLGLGLPIVKHAVARLSGVLSVDSTLGEGTTVTITLPAWQPTQDYQLSELQSRLDASHRQSLIYARDIRLLYDQLKSHFVDTLASITGALEARDNYLRGHTERVTHLAERIARRLGYSERDLKGLEIAGRLHDIGKIGVPDAMLYATDGLPDHSTAIVQHIELGRRILEPLHFLQPILPLVLAHHERYDGLGFPEGLGGEQIPQGARILAVANDFDIMTSPRPHRDAITSEQAIHIIRNGAGREWDPVVVEAFLAVMAEDEPDVEESPQAST